MNISEVEDIEEDLVDPHYTQTVQGTLLPKIDWNQDEQDQIRVTCFPVIRKTEQWLRKQRLGKLTIRRNPVPLRKGSSNQHVGLCLAGASQVKLETSSAKASLEEWSSPHVTRSKTRGKGKKES